LCAGTTPREHRLKERAIRWVKIKRALGSFQGGEEYLERGKREKGTSHNTPVERS